ncbi:polyprenyl synthetase family protein [Candidatus Vesicomyidisocius sp. SY067_SCS001]|uniref:polyprenyl synthetase family protein n=1 Tax=Candidatus Vesicomyidisocius sp. SY067_SCS001 TaxID=2732590 RepID=UPI001683D9F3|nr:farnesyl diphosphate synthase [Candidatus Vesicomyosocius sp. SY067_SCS001]
MDFNTYITRVNTKLEKCLPAHGYLTKAMRYSTLTNGKRFRPILTYSVANTFSTHLDLVDSSSCAVEFIHAYSLIHDDLPAMDDDDIRHNQPTCHKLFGEAQAILVGDGLQTLAFKVLVNDNLIGSDTKIELIKSLTHASFEMAEGQAIDLSIIAKQVNITTLEIMHRKKTGALLNCAVNLGAIISKNCNNKDHAILNIFSKDIGLAYQIQDDVLDIETPDELLGKKQYSDKYKNKPTYPSLLGLDKSRLVFKDLYEKAIDEISLLSVDAVELQQLTAKLQERLF